MPVWFDKDAKTATFIGFDPDNETATLFPVSIDTRYYIRNKDKIVPVNAHVTAYGTVVYEIPDKEEAATHCLQVLREYLNHDTDPSDGNALDGRDLEAASILTTLLGFYKIKNAKTVHGWCVSEDGHAEPHAWTSVPGSELGHPETETYYLSATVDRFTGRMPMKYECDGPVMLPGLHPNVVLERPDGPGSKTAGPQNAHRALITYDEMFDRVRTHAYETQTVPGNEGRQELERRFRQDLVNMLKNKYGMSEGAAMLVCARAAATAGHPRHRSHMAVLLNADSLAQLFMDMKAADENGGTQLACPVCGTELDGTAADFDDAEETAPGRMAAPAGCPCCGTDLTAVYEAGPYELVRFETAWPETKRARACKQESVKP